jgi:hypothetical protein
MMKLMIVGLQISILIGLSGAAAQTQAPAPVVKPLTEKDIALLRHDVQAEETEIITKAMRFTDAEAAAFWPVYKDYAKEKMRIGAARYRLTKDYAQNHRRMTDAQAAQLADKELDLDKAEAETEANYWPKFAKVLTPQRAVEFYQVDRRVTLMIGLEAFSYGQSNVDESQESAFIYVDGTNGSDSNPGSPDKPLRTIGAAAAIAQTNNQAGIGTQVNVNPGTYREAISLLKTPNDTALPMTFQSNPNPPDGESGPVIVPALMSLGAGNLMLITQRSTRFHGLTNTAYAKPIRTAQQTAPPMKKTSFCGAKW